MVKKALCDTLRIGLCFMLAGSLILSYPVVGSAAWGKGEEEKKAEEAKKKAEAAEKARKAAIEEKRNMVKDAKAKLNGTVWSIEVKQLGELKKEKGKKKGAEQFSDTLRFINEQIASDTLKEDGFSRTNFSVRIKEKRGPTGKDLIIWETMQTSAEEGLAFWRGEYEDEDTVMKGALSRHYAEDNIQNYTFSGSKGSGEKKAPSVEEEVATAEETAAEVEADKSDKTEEKAQEKIEKVREKAEEKVKRLEETQKDKPEAEEKTTKKKKKRGLW